MSLDVRYLTNGVKSFYVVKNSGVRPIHIQAYEKLEDIPKSIRHYAPKGDAVFTLPDLAWILGYGSILYPDFPACGQPRYEGMRCIAEGCVLAPDGDWTKCPYFPKPS